MSKNFQNNETLINALNEGDENAFRYLVKEFQRKLLAYTISLTNDHFMAQDIVQEVFLKTWKNRKKLRHNQSINGFLYKSVYNEFINAYHKKQAILKLEKNYFNALSKIVQEANDSKIEKKIALVSEEIDRLPKKCRQTFLLSKKEGLTNIEISEHLGISIKTVEARITKAYSIIRKNTKEKFEQIFWIFFKPVRRIFRQS